MSRILTSCATAASLVALIATLACSPSGLVDVQSPSTVVDPSQVQTTTGAIRLRNNALGVFMGAFGQNARTSVVAMSGTVTDELQDPGYQGTSGDDRHLLTLNNNQSQRLQGFGYDQIQSARVQVRQALQALQVYAANSPQAPVAWQGEMYALQGYTIVWLAELYCSGIPLSASYLNGTQVPARGSTTAEMFAAAIALFDSAMVVGVDSAQFVNLARVGKARALLDLGQFAAADSAVQNVPTEFVYLVGSSDDGFAQSFNMPSQDEPYGLFMVRDREGGNGLVWSTDPRTAVVSLPELSGSMLWPAKYNLDPATGAPDPTTPRTSVPLRLADGLEARLIQAEAALARNDDSWLTTLNMLRSTCVTTAACAPRAGLAADALPPITDPGAATRLDTLMKERAMWLYLTGHREGDLRRMAHVYGRDPNTLWPTGTIVLPTYPNYYPTPGPNNGLPYGPDVVYGPDVNEHAMNPLYGGCYDTRP